MTRIPESEWRWFGNAAHFISADACRFHMTTEIGGFVVSTVGEMVPDSQVQEIYGNLRGLNLEGKGDARQADFLRKNGYEKLGAWGTYETLVFRVKGHCTSEDCACGLPGITGSELDGQRFDSRREATEGHRNYCERVANGITQWDDDAS